MQGSKVLLDFPFPEERVFRYQAMQDILHHLVNNPFGTFTQQELASLTGADISSISRALDLLDELGVISVEEGHPSKISIEPEHLQLSDPLFTIPQAEFRKPIRAYQDELTTRIEESDEIDELVGLVLFGSVARGSADRRSDVDLLVIVAGDLTHGRRLCTSIARNIEEQSFDGQRYEFEVLVETPETAVSHGTELVEIFDEGLILGRSERLGTIRQAIYTEPTDGD